MCIGVIYKCLSLGFSSVDRFRQAKRRIGNPSHLCGKLSEASWVTWLRNMGISLLLSISKDGLICCSAGNDLATQVCMSFCHDQRKNDFSM